MARSVGLIIDDKTDAVLDVFAREGYATTGLVIDVTGYSRPTVAKRLDRLRTADVIAYVHEPTAFWKLRFDPRDSD